MTAIENELNEVQTFEIGNYHENPEKRGQNECYSVRKQILLKLSFYLKKIGELGKFSSYFNSAQC